MALSELIVSLLSLFLVIGVGSISSIKLSDTVLASSHQLVHEGISFISTLDEDDALIQFASSEDLFQIMKLESLGDLHIVLLQLV